MPTRASFAVWAAVVALSAGHKKHCVKDYDDLKAGDGCTATWRDLTSAQHLLPTQPSLGYAWVHQQKEKAYSSKKEAEKELKKDVFPVVLGKGKLYLTDRHHHAAALQLTNDKDIFDLDMHLLVICDLRFTGAIEFWTKMRDMHYVFLQKRVASPFELPSAATEMDLPVNWSLDSFQDDLWRSIAGFADHVTDDKMRCYVKKCQEYFVDFQWGFAINKATEAEPHLWPSAEQQTAFRAKLHALPYPSLKNVDLKTWEELGDLALPLCHSTNLSSLPLPAGYASNSLQGWSRTPLPKDPRCDYDTCRSGDGGLVVV